MTKTLIIAEKPSVASDLARVLSRKPGMTKFRREGDYFENETHVISSAIGHLVELALPGEADGNRPKWKFESLPIIPETFALQPREKGQERLKLLKRLIKRADIGELVNACDAGREGELIFRYIMEATGARKPIRRLWMQSMTDQAILEAFQHLRPDSEMRALANAALCRSESDWLVGINATRALTAHNSRLGGFRLTPAGRVQTPTLAILVSRHKDISAFEPRAFWEVYGDFGVEKGVYRGRWFREDFQKDERNAFARAERLWAIADAEAIRSRCEKRTGTVSETRKPSRQVAPLLYDLTSLQREASNRFGFSARRTLQLAQGLYEKHKALTYPRTDSRYLPEDYLNTVRNVMQTISARSGGVLTNLPALASRLLTEDRISPSRRIFDGSKVRDHFAIIPTDQIPAKLDEAEQKLYDMVARRFVAVFYPAAEFEITTRITRIASAEATDAFLTEGKVLLVPGWLEVYGKKLVDDDDSSVALCEAKDGESALNRAIEVKEEVTKPPPHYTEATLLSAMEGAGKLVDDEELREAMSERGLGTPATRAQVIEGLILDGYVVRNGRDLVATPKGIQLIDQLHEAGVEVLASPEMTGQWEYQLKQMELGRAERSAFMREIRELAAKIVERTKAFSAKAKEVVLPDLDLPCPLCGAVGLKQTETFVSCHTPKCKLRIYRTIAARPITREELQQLLTKKFVGPLDGFRSRFGKDFSAALELKETGKADFVFEKSPQQEAAVVAAQDPANILCPCPVCREQGRSSNIYDTPAGYICETHLREKGDRCKPKASLPRELCKVPINRDQALAFFTEGRTGVIDKFISKKGRPFSAQLLCDVKGKRLLRWEFPPRAAKPKSPRKKTPAAPVGG
ncbi:MAG: DNA topoisomerase 3 [Verrucomicrobiales bacterium]